MSLIYKPRGRAREYAPLACNVYRGCDHRCVYCYAPNATYQQREEFGRPQLRKEFIKKLRREVQHPAPKRQQVLLSFTCDPYQSFDIQHQITRQTIEILHAAGMPVQVLTKGGSRSLRDIDLFTPDDAFAATLTWLDDKRSLEWEPGAAMPSDRINTLYKFHQAGVPTWVSLEPVLDPAVAIQIIHKTHTFIDLFKVGKLNYHPLAQQIDWRAFGIAAIGLLESLHQPYYIKADLLECLPSQVVGAHHITVAELEQKTTIAPIHTTQLAMAL